MRDFSSTSTSPTVFGGKKNLREKVVTPGFHVLGYSFLLDENNLYCSVMFEEKKVFTACLDAVRGTVNWMTRDEGKTYSWVDLGSYILVGPLVVSKAQGEIMFDFSSIEGFVGSPNPIVCRPDENHIVIEFSERDSSGLYICLSLSDFSYSRMPLGLSSIRLHQNEYYGWKEEGSVSTLFSFSDPVSTPTEIGVVDHSFDSRFVEFLDGFLVLYDEHRSAYYQVDLKTAASQKLNFPDGIQGTASAHGSRLFVTAFGVGLFVADLHTGSVTGPISVGVMEWSVLVEDGVLYTVERRGDFERWDIRGGDHFICARAVDSLELLWDAPLKHPGRAVMSNSQGLYVEPLGNAGVVQFFRSKSGE